MQKQEIKAAIAAKVIEIKALKKVLSRPHSELAYGGSNEMYQLYRLRQEIRAMYLVYAWYRGYRHDQVESKPLELSAVSYQVKKILDDDEKVALFGAWLESTHQPMETSCPKYHTQSTSTSTSAQSLRASAR